MFCPQCGSNLPDGAAFCGNCGSPISRSVVVSSASASSSPASPAPVQTAPAPGAPKDKKRVVIAVVVAVVVVALVAIGAFLKINADRQAYELAHTQYPLSITVKADGFDVASASPVPVAITGTNFEGAAVEEHVLVGNGQETPCLERGSYTVKVESTPISGEGVLYDVSSSSGTVDIVAAENGGANASVVLVMVAFDPLDVSAEQIQTAIDALRSHGVSDSMANSFRTLATNWVENAQAQKAAEEQAAAEAAAQAEAEAAAQAEAEAAAQAAAEAAAQASSGISNSDEAAEAARSYHLANYPLSGSATADHVYAEASQKSSTTWLARVYYSHPTHDATLGWYLVDSDGNVTPTTP